MFYLKKKKSNAIFTFRRTNMGAGARQPETADQLRSWHIYRVQSDEGPAGPATTVATLTRANATLTSVSFHVFMV